MIPIKIKYTTYCCLCDNEHEIEYDLPFGAEIMKYGQPQNWIKINDYLICDKHNVDEISAFLKVNIMKIK